MMRFITPIILIIIAVSVFFTFTNPFFNDISALKTEAALYNEALDNNKALLNERDKLTAKFNSIDKQNLANLEKLLPNNVNNIRLILEIEKIATPYGMALKDVKYEDIATTSTGTTAGVVAQAVTAKTIPKDYGVFFLSFSVTGSYNNFINFTKDLEKNLRIMDISSVAFSSDVGSTGLTGIKTISSEIYTYNFKIKTYWLK